MGFCNKTAVITFAKVRGMKKGVDYEKDIEKK